MNETDLEKAIECETKRLTSEIVQAAQKYIYSTARAVKYTPENLADAVLTQRGIKRRSKRKAKAPKKPPLPGDTKGGSHGHG